MAKAAEKSWADGVSNDESEPEVLELKSKKDKDTTRVTLFTIDDEPYTVPKKPSFKIVMRYLNVARKSGNDLFAAQQLCEDMLGSEAWEKFLEWDDMDDETMGKVIERCVNLATASVNETAEK